jgi:adenine-specific DNA-methyltransferase
VIHKDFLDWASDCVGTLPFGGHAESFDIVVMNPPYRKLNTGTKERRALERLGVEVSNLYVAFLALSCAILATDGQIAAITPRSFANGPYFRSFRRFFFDRVVFDRIHLFESRSTVFAGDAVLQENIIFSAKQNLDGEPHERVVISASVGADQSMTFRDVPYSEVVSPNDPDCFVHIVTDDNDAAISELMSRLPARLSDLGLEVSTGRVVDFRSREHLREEASSDTVPLLYPGNLRDGGVVWPGTIKKPTSIVACDVTSKLLLPAETFVLVKRFTSKEERRRVAASVLEPSDVQTARVGFENHLNVFHCSNRGLEGQLARGLAAWLNSTVVDRYFRSFNGHTQVNATDLRRLPYPSAKELLALGNAMGTGRTSDQEKIDNLVSANVKVLKARAE